MGAFSIGSREPGAGSFGVLQKGFDVVGSSLKAGLRTGRLLHPVLPEDGFHGGGSAGLFG